MWPLITAGIWPDFLRKKLNNKSDTGGDCEGGLNVTVSEKLIMCVNVAL